MSLRARLVIAACVVSILALGAAGVATVTLFSHSQLRQVDDSLRRTHAPLESLVGSDRDSVEDGGSFDPDADQDIDHSIEQLAPGQLVMVLGADGVAKVSIPAREPGHDPLT